MSKIRDGLVRQTEQFASGLQELLNKTVCDFAQVQGRVRPDGTQSIVGTNLDELTSRPIELRSNTATPLWLDISAYLMLDEDEGTFLTVRSSVWALSVGNPPQDVLHYDYERDKDRYTEAHLQICASHPGLETFLGELGRKEVGALAKIHLPVGGRRFRPALEDLLECLINEGLVEPQAGWQKVLNDSRQGYRDKQVAAAIRRRPDIAISELRRLGHVVTEPSDKTLLAKIRRLVSGTSSQPDARPKKNRPKRR